MQTEQVQLSCLNQCYEEGNGILTWENQEGTIKFELGSWLTRIG